MNRMKGADDFLIVLTIAIILIVVFALFSLLVPYQPAPPPGVNETIVVSQFKIGTVGFAADFQAKSASLGSFNVGEVQTEGLKSVPQITVSAGLLGGESQAFDINVDDVYLETIRGVKISFDVYETNQYGDLVVTWNGKEFYRGKAAPREYTIDISPDYVKNSNELKIYCDGPGLMFWASTVYTIRNFDVGLEYGPDKFFSFKLLSSEISAFNRGEINFIGTGSTGRMEIKVNGVNVYDGLPSGVVNARFNFSTVPLNIGDNIVTFKGIGGVFNLQNANIKIYLSKNEIVRSREFNISGSEYEWLNEGRYRGRISFDVLSILRGGSLDIKLNGKPLNVPQVRAGENRAYFSVSDVNAGRNELVFSGTGYFDIDNVEIELERI